MIATCTTEHQRLAEEAGSIELLRPVGFIKAYEDAAAFAADLAKAEGVRRDFGVNFAALDPGALGAAEPHLRTGFAGALHWTDPYAVNDPHALTLSYAALVERLGGCFVHRLASGQFTAFENRVHAGRLLSAGHEAHPCPSHMTSPMARA